MIALYPLATSYMQVIGEMGLVGMETRIRTAMQNAGAGRGRTITALPAKRGELT